MYPLIMTIAYTQMQSSDLSRNPNKVYSSAEREPVLLTRRDGRDLLLMSADEGSARTQLLELAAQLFSVATDEHGTRISRMCSVFPWMFSLSESGRESCTEDIFRALKGSLATSQARLVVNEVESWKETAIAMAAGMHLDVESYNAADDFVSVERP